MDTLLRSYFQKMNFLLGRNPRYISQPNWRKLIPTPYKAVVLVSADFELAWAWRYTKSSKNPLQKALDKAKIERENIPKILETCERFDIPITWLTVGHLMLENCSSEGGLPHPELIRPDHFENSWWKFEGNDWYEHDPCSNYLADPLWYCPDLITKIIESKVGHEIGCHTFSHIDCRDEICSPELFKAEIEACQKEANPFGINKMESFVHPGHRIGNLETLVKMGYTNFRTDNANILGFPKRHSTGLWEFSTTLEFEFQKNWSINSQINRYILTLKRAIKKNSVAYFWFHPSLNPLFVTEIMPSVFEWLDLHREDIWITSSGEYVKWLNKYNVPEN